MEYNIIDYRESDLVRLDVKINYELASPMACIVHRDAAQSIGRRLVSSLKDLIPRQMFKNPNPGLRWCQGNCVRGHFTHEEGCARQVLWWRYFTKEKAPQQASQGKEANEGHWKSECTTGSIHGGVEIK